MSSPTVEVTKMSWVALNEALRKCSDESVLQHWLDVTLRSTHAARNTRCLRIYGRLTVVRRTRELKELRLKMKEAA